MINFCDGTLVYNFASCLRHAEIYELQMRDQDVSGAENRKDGEVFKHNQKLRIVLRSLQQLCVANIGRYTLVRCHGVQPPRPLSTEFRV